MDYYDFVLGIIPSSLVGIAGALMLVGIESTVAVPLAAVVSIGVISHAVFVNGPVETDVAAPGTDDRGRRSGARSPGSASGD